MSIQFFHHKKSIFVLLFVLSVLLFVSCKKNSNSQHNSCSLTCTPNACTDNFDQIELTIKNSDGTAVRLDRYYTIRDEDQAIIDLQTGASRYEDSVHKALGNYPVFHDGNIGTTNRCGKVFYFIAIKDSVQILRERYDIAHNCCHVVRQTGRTEIIR